MTTIRREISLDIHPDKVWDAVRDIGSAHRLFQGVLTDSSLDGDIRVVTFANGLVAREVVVSLDDAARRFVYSVVEGMPGLTHHNASMEVLAEGSDRTRFVWTTDVLPDDLGPRVAELVELGMAALRRTLER
ncbi:SRPBCC family protein [Nocardia crassostreae]|uniref:SRPBCC family protein n=1 Tax=Nocardia crassostreae TaxID=53428 RepID=UPI00082FB90D|nr:SRPBCC family protein [Nocardia crassostreae]